MPWCLGSLEYETEQSYRHRETTVDTSGEVETWGHVRVRAGAQATTVLKSVYQALAPPEE